MAKQFEWEPKALERARDNASALHKRVRALEYPYHLPLDDGTKLVIEKEPEILRDKNGELTSVDAWVRAYRADGRELKVDPHRVMSAPPVKEEDPAAFFLRNVTESVIQAPNPRGWNTKGTVSQFFSAPSPGSISSTNGTYATARTGGTLATLGTTSNLIGQNTGFVCYESFLNFASGATIPDADIVSVVTLDMAMSTYSGTAYTINVREKVWSAGGLTTADWTSGASLTGTLVASRSTSGMSTLPTLTTFTSQAAFLTTANLKTGNVELVLSSSRHEAGTSPSSNEITSWDIDTSVGGRLTVTHNSAGSFPPILQRNTPRIWSVYS